MQTRKSLRVALTGTHGVGKTYITEKLKEELVSRGFSVSTMPSITRLLKDRGYPINDTDSLEVWKTQLTCAIERSVIESQLDGNSDILLADRWVLDEYVYAQHLLKKDLGLEEGLVESVFSVLESLVKETIESSNGDWWDLRYFKPVHPDYLPEEDGHREADLGFQASITKIYEELDENTRGKELPKDRDEAYQVVLEDILARI